HLSRLGRGHEQEALRVRDGKRTRAYRYKAACAWALRQRIVAASIQDHDLLARPSSGLEEVVEQYTTPHGAFRAVDTHIDRREHIAVGALHTVAGEEHEGEVLTFGLLGQRL